jgi:ABC-type polar amino acid transport system ATPase subunit
MLVTTPEMGFARAMADRIVFMDKGEIVEGGAGRVSERPRSERTRLVLG